MVSARCPMKSTARNARYSSSCEKTTASTDPMRVLESRTFVRARHVLPRSRAWTRSCGDALASVLASPETMQNRLQKPSLETMRHDGLQTSAARRRLAGSPGKKQTRSPPLARLPAGAPGRKQTRSPPLAWPWCGADWGLDWAVLVVRTEGCSVT